MAPSPNLLLTCEHGGNRVPRAHAARFRGRQRLLASHRGFDPGALSVARALAAATGAPLLAVTTTRLLVDPNRSPHNPAVFSEFTRGLPRAEREALLARHHAPHWRRVRDAVACLGPGRRPVLHVAVHSFTPVLRGERRAFDLGLLYDPRRAGERALARRWQQHLRGVHGLAVRRNAPYRGVADGLTTALRRERGPRAYLGLELELHQGRLEEPAWCREIVAALAGCLHDSM